jgi:PP-loop superfamily ATP-utilizing enzyme
MRDHTPQPAAAPDQPAQQSYHYILSGQNIRSGQEARPLLGVLSEDGSCWYLWPVGFGSAWVRTELARLAREGRLHRTQRGRYRVQRGRLSA